MLDGLDASASSTWQTIRVATRPVGWAATAGRVQVSAVYAQRPPWVNRQHAVRLEMDPIALASLQLVAVGRPRS